MSIFGKRRVRSNKNLPGSFGLPTGAPTVTPSQQPPTAGSAAPGSVMQYPHCDAGVLHKPGDCRYCDMHPDWQELRETWGLNFTGEYDPSKMICPAEQHRDLALLNKWGGNRSHPADADEPSEQKVQAVIAEATHLLRRLRPS